MKMWWKGEPLHPDPKDSFHLSEPPQGPTGGTWSGTGSADDFDTRGGFVVFSPTKRYVAQGIAALERFLGRR